MHLELKHGLRLISINGCGTKVKPGDTIFVEANITGGFDFLNELPREYLKLKSLQILKHFEVYRGAIFDHMVQYNPIETARIKSLLLLI